MKGHITIYPRTTEKAYGMSKNNVYVFDAPVDANKQEIVAAVEKQYDVKVARIKTLIQDGKAKRMSRGKRNQPATINVKDLKKAYVMLAEGSSIKVFEEVTEQPDVKAAKKEKK